MTDANNIQEVAIRLSGVKKRYVLGQIGGRTLQADIQSWWARKRGKEDPNTKIGQETRLVGQSFMALNGIDLTIYKGEAVGIIGSNGAGKSTMLKLIARVTAPTEGEIDLYGRVASMLEVGTGFNGEMTGRENIYMNGAILGMTKAEIDAKMEQIIDFSEVRDFIDTPVKRYSSGMYVKLAFSVAAHLDNEIMIMDEVLAVGDVAFQKKCINKMKEVANKEGRTVLYVSHNMDTIQHLCSRCIVLDQGKLIYDGNVESAVAVYLRTKQDQLSSNYIRPENAINDLKTYITAVRLSDSVIEQGVFLKGYLEMDSEVFIERAIFKSLVKTAADQPIGIMPSEEFAINKGHNKICFSIDTSNFAVGSYRLDIIINEIQKADYVKVDEVLHVIGFSVQSSIRYYNQDWSHKYWGNVLFNKILINH